jgi:hypothetical protein
VESWTTPETVPSAASAAIRANTAIIMALDYTVSRQPSARRRVEENPADSARCRLSGAFTQALGALDASPRAKFLDADFEGVDERNFLLVG